MATSGIDLSQQYFCILVSELIGMVIIIIILINNSKNSTDDYDADIDDPSD